MTTTETDRLDSLTVGLGNLAHAQDQLGMVNVHQPNPTPRDDAQADKRRLWMSKEYERLMAEGLMQ